jgi:hypothetical protein
LFAASKISLSPNSCARILFSWRVAVRTVSTCLALRPKWALNSLTFCCSERITAMVGFLGSAYAEYSSASTAT